MKQINLLLKKQSSKEAFFVTIILGLLVHIYKFTNYLPNWDSMYLMDTSLTGMMNFGRWFSGLAAALSSTYSLPWISGLFSLIFLALSMVIIVDLFEIQNRVLILLSCALLVTFPSITATFAYMEWSDAYFLSLFLSLMAIYLCVRFEKGFIPAILLIAFSMGIYQIYITTAILCFVLFIIKQYIYNENYKKQSKKVIIKFFVAIFGGAIVYSLINKIVLSAFGTTLSSYQGISNVGYLGIKGYIKAIKNVKSNFSDFFALEKGISVYGILNIIFFILLAYIVLRSILFVKKDSMPIYKKVLIFLLLFSCIFISYAYYFVSANVYYHTLMLIGLYFMYFMCIIFLDKNSKLSNWTRKASIFIMILLCIYNSVNANIAYAKMNMSYEKSFYNASEILYKIDSVASQDNHKIAIIGNFPDEEEKIKVNPQITGVSEQTFLISEYHICQFFKYYFNRDFSTVDSNMKSKIINSEEFKSLDVYPYGKCVKVIDGVIVVKLSK